jgi:hypothetical protein
MQDIVLRDGLKIGLVYIALGGAGGIKNVK